MKKPFFACFLLMIFFNIQGQNNYSFSENTCWIGAITLEDSNLPVGRRDFHSPSLKKPEISAIYDSINPLALKSIYLRKSLIINKQINNATLRICGLGHYVLWVNGKKVSNDLFNPSWSDYDKTLYYNTLQIDTLLSTGENVLGVMLGNGFYNAVGNRYRKLWMTFGAPTLFAELAITFTDGSEQRIVSDKTWKFAESPITFNDIYGGEDYDAQMEQSGWNCPKFNDLQWSTAVVQTAPKGKLREQKLTPVRCMQTFEVKSAQKIDSTYILDMGQNVSGYPSVKLSGKRGQTIKLIVGEQLDSQGKVSQKQSGSPHYYTYTLRGDGVEEWHPDFSYYGFRYIQIEGAEEIILKSETPENQKFTVAHKYDNVVISDIKSHFIYNSVEEIGNFECSNQLLNKTHELIKNAVRSNMQSVFTDCPHREKLGWLEQTHLNCGALLYNWDMRQFFPKIMQDIADAQLDNGFVPNIAPEYVVFGEGLDDFRDSPEWGIAAIMLPYLHYQFYGDKSLIINYFDVMQRYVDYLTSRSVNHIVSHGLGDWYDYGEHRAGFSKNSPIEVSATAHYFYAAHLLSVMAKIIDRKVETKRYDNLAIDIKKAFNTKFFNPTTKQYSNGSQFCNSVAIFMEIVEPKYKAAVLENLKDDIKKHGNRLTTGDVGNRYLFQTLALNGCNDLLYTMLNHEETPGYGFQLKFGATTLTEQWDPRNGNSWNHFMLGQIDEWFFRELAGIEPSKNGFEKFVIAPKTAGDLTFVNASYKTVYGEISVQWKRTNDNFELTVNLPQRTSATIILPNGKTQRVGAGKHNFSCKTTK
ncbi:MAG: glycoside hydrolase family 78 protein [Paludibacter sp.]|jgi:hypothetical protein|nr:glycoside hydrolase family 78 protein [Paludibacter sp.]